MEPYEVRGVVLTFIEADSKEDAVNKFKQRYPNTRFDFIDAESVYEDKEEENSNNREG